MIFGLVNAGSSRNFPAVFDLSQFNDDHQVSALDDAFQQSIQAALSAPVRNGNAITTTETMMHGEPVECIANSKYVGCVSISHNVRCKVHDKYAECIVDDMDDSPVKIFIPPATAPIAKN